jgi:hypothetical protein
MAVEKIWVIYCIYINLMQSSSTNHWIKINFDSKWTLSFKMLSCKSLSLLLVFRIAKGYHQDCSLLCTIIFVIHHLFGWKVVHPLCAFTLLCKCKLQGVGFTCTIIHFIKAIGIHNAKMVWKCVEFVENATWKHWKNIAYNKKQ